MDDVIYQDIQKDDPYKDHKYRRLIFERTENLVQSEALLSKKSESRSSSFHGEGLIFHSVCVFLQLRSVQLLVCVCTFKLCVLCSCYQQLQVVERKLFTTT